MADVTLRHGEPEVVDYTPSGGAIDAGDVILLGNLTGINLGVAQVDIPNTRKGALAVRGGVWEGINLNNAAQWATVYWDNTAKKFTTVSTNMAKFGYIVRDGGGGANSTAWAMLEPRRGEGE